MNGRRNIFTAVDWTTSGGRISGDAAVDWTTSGSRISGDAAVDCTDWTSGSILAFLGVDVTLTPCIRTEHCENDVLHVIKLKMSPMHEITVAQQQTS